MTKAANKKPESEFKTIREKFESEIAPVPWKDLQRSFARGITLYVTPDLNLVDVAVEIAEDNTSAVETWMENRKIVVVSDDQARAWLDSNEDLLTAIVKPWVLIQTIDSQ